MKAAGDVDGGADGRGDDGFGDTPEEDAGRKRG